MSRLRLVDFQITGEYREAVTGEYCLVDTKVIMWEGDGKTSSKHIILVPRTKTFNDGFSDRESILRFLDQYRQASVPKIITMLKSGADYAIRYEVKQFTDSDSKNGTYFCVWDTNMGIPAGQLRVSQHKTEKECEKMNADFVARMGCQPCA